MATISKRMNFNNSGFYFIGLVALVLLGFWPSYFSQFAHRTIDYNFYFHTHAILMATWIAMLIAQPILIRKKKIKWHRIVGKASYVVMPLLFISILLLVHFVRGKHYEPGMGVRLYIPMKDLLLLGTFYGIAIYRRKNLAIHARAMISTGIVFIEPALSRFVIGTFFRENGIVGYLLSISMIYALIILLIVLERKQPAGRWVFPLLLAMYLFVHAMFLFQVHVPIWEDFAKWFIELPIT